MEAGKKNFVQISEDNRRNLEESIYQEILDNFRCENLEKNIYKYRVILQNLTFVTVMKDSALKESISLVLDIMEELKVINNNGITQKIFQEKEKEISEKCENEVFYMIEIWQIIRTPKLLQLIVELDKVYQVGGAYAMLISNPSFQSAINAVFEQIVDKFDDKDLYAFSAYFLARAAMRMRSNEECEDEVRE